MRYYEVAGACNCERTADEKAPDSQRNHARLSVLLSNKRRTNLLPSLNVSRGRQGGGGGGGTVAVQSSAAAVAASANSTLTVKIFIRQSHEAHLCTDSQGGYIAI